MTFKHCFYEWLVLRSFLVISGFVIKKTDLLQPTDILEFGKAKINGISVFEKVLCSISHEFSPSLLFFPITDIDERLNFLFLILQDNGCFLGFPLEFCAGN